MFLLLFSLILSLIPVLKPFFFLFMYWFRFVFLLNLLEFCHHVYSFLVHNEMNATCLKPKGDNYLNLPIATNFYAYTCDIAFCSYVFILILSLALHTKRQFTYQEPFKYFTVIVHTFRNLFWKICHLFRQILITCLKCSRVSFSLFSYSEKMRQGPGSPKYALAAQYFQILVISN